MPQRKSKSLLDKLLPVLHEDGILLAIDKPWGIDTGGLDKQDAPGILEMLHDLRGGETLLPVNRLSRYESGVLVLAKSPEIAEQLRAGFKTHHVPQSYYIVCLGKMSRNTVRIDDEFGASRGKVKGTKRVRTKKTSKRKSDPVGSARGPATKLQRIAVGESRTLVRLETSAAKTHAVRAQLRAVRMRALGDPLHNKAPRKMDHARTCLHLATVSLHHPVKRRNFVIESAPPPAFEDITRGGKELSRALRAAMLRRYAALFDRDTNAMRILSGEVEDAPGLVIERYADVGIIYAESGKVLAKQIALPVAKMLRDYFKLTAVYLREMPRSDPKGTIESETGRGSRRPKPLVGEPTPPDVVINERGLRFLLRPFEGASAGLFLDHREGRTIIRKASAGKSVLNLFAYTCGFSVAAAAGGASRVVSVDLAPKYLDWGKENFELNGLPIEPHEFIAADAADYLPRAKKKGEAFDIVVIDPPSFAHGRKRGRDFSIARDLADLVSSANEVLADDGLLLVSTNFRKMSLRGLREHIKRGLRGRPHKVVDAPKLPPDFAMDPDYQKTLVVRLG